MTRSRIKKAACGPLILSFLFLASGSIADKRIPCRESRAPEQERTFFSSAEQPLSALSQRLDSELALGNLKRIAIQTETSGEFVHERFEVLHMGLRVWGAQILRHSRNGSVYLIHGDFIDGLSLDVSPSVSQTSAIATARAPLSDPSYKLAKTPELVIFREGDEYRLAYQVTYGKFDSLIASFVDAKTGRLLFQTEEVKTTRAIGLGTGTLNDVKKMSTDYRNSTYYAVDVMRPATITTGDSLHSTDASVTYYVTDSDNNWTSDGTVVDGHTYLGWTYDYYYLVHNWQGMDNANRDLVLTVHLGYNYENAFFHPTTKWMYFGDGNPETNYPFTTALDIVAHEFTHGITDATSNLNYIYESGALNEAFSDIMAVSCEFFHQPAGQGYMKAEWWQGEDIEKTFGPGRSLNNPSGVRIWAGYDYVYPDHYSKRYILAGTSDEDYGGVHINCTIPSHWYYLLAHGGTNKTSGIAVTGIGLSKAEKIAFKTWAYYLRPSSNFAAARKWSLQAAADLYGAGSAEAQAVARAWTAVGVN